MGLSYQSGNYARDFNSVYNITLDMSGWDRTAVQIVSPITGTLYVYGSNDSGALLGVREGDASLATNFNPIQAVNLATGVATNVISAAGTYKVDINDQYLRLQGSPAGAGSSVYGILFNHSKVG